MMLTSCSNHWADDYDVSAAGKYRHASLSLPDGNMAEGEDGEKLSLRESGSLFF